MTKLLSDEKRRSLWLEFNVDYETIYAIEAAVLEELAKQKPVTKFNVGRFCLSEDDCIEQGIPFFAYERGVADAAVAFDRNDARNRTQVPIAWQRHKTVILEEDWTADDHNGWIPLYATEDAAPVVQPDMVMVPREPTETIVKAMEQQWMRGSQIDMAKREYRAMIAAAEGKKE